MQFVQYFQSLGFSSREASVYQALYHLGSQPASVIAKYVDIERTSVYKILLGFSQKNIVSLSEKHGIKYFFIPSLELLHDYVKQERSRLAQMEKDFDHIAIELTSKKKHDEKNFPKITIYDGAEGIKNCYHDIYLTIENTGYRSCRLFASNILTAQSGKASIVDIYANEFFEQMHQHGYEIDATIGNGVSLMEMLERVSDIELLRNLPAANESIQVFVAGENVYIILFREIPFGIKIASNELAQVFHVLLEKVSIK